MSRNDKDTILTKQDLIILSFIYKKKEPIPKTEIHTFSKEHLKKEPSRTNDCLCRLRKCQLINEVNGEKRGSKKIKIYKDNEPIVEFFLKWFNIN